VKRLIIILALAGGFTQMATASDTDSLVVGDLQYLKKRINILLYQLNQMEETTAGELDSLRSLSRTSIREMEQFQSQASRNHQSLQDSIQRSSSHLHSFILQTRGLIKLTSTIHIVLFGLILALTLLLLILYLRERRKSIDRLIKKTEKMAQQNDQILEKTSELREIRSDLEKSLKQQKKLKKRVKKIKK
jgi:predicted PurR-regulated permease PerM